MKTEYKVSGIKDRVYNVNVELLNGDDWCNLRMNAGEFEYEALVSLTHREIKMQEDMVLRAFGDEVVVDSLLLYSICDLAELLLDIHYQWQAHVAKDEEE